MATTYTSLSHQSTSSSNFPISDSQQKINNDNNNEINSSTNHNSQQNYIVTQQQYNSNNNTQNAQVNAHTQSNVPTASSTEGLSGSALAQVAAQKKYKPPHIRMKEANTAGNNNKNNNYNHNNYNNNNNNQYTSSPNYPQQNNNYNYNNNYNSNNNHGHNVSNAFLNYNNRNNNRGNYNNNSQNNNNYNNNNRHYNNQYNDRNNSGSSTLLSRQSLYNNNYNSNSLQHNNNNNNYNHQNYNNYNNNSSSNHNNNYNQNHNYNNNYNNNNNNNNTTAAATTSNNNNNQATNLYNAMANPKSITKTGWDVRNGRRYIPDNERDIFDSSPKVHTGINFDSYDNIPVELTGNGANNLPPIESFQSTSNVHELLMKNVTRVNYSRPTPIQKHAIPVIINGRDLMACAQTGSGKTAAFLFPTISLMLKLGPPAPLTSGRVYLARKDPAMPVCLVLSPTRELTLQIYQEARKFTFGTGIRTCVIYGGNDVRTQIYELDKGCDICVATPGRLKDLIERSKVNLEFVSNLVLDEADRMLDMGFYPQMRDIVFESKMPSSRASGGRRQTVMFSATFPREVQQLAKEFLHDYIFLSVGRVGSTNTFISQKLMYVQEDQKQIFLRKLLKETLTGLILIFVETKRKCDQIDRTLNDDDVLAVSIHGDKSQAEREDALRFFKEGQCRVLVATDVAARGLDIPNITHVINYDVPSNVDDYVHRIGRTGRAGNKGLATSFINESNWPVFRDLVAILNESQQEIPPWFQHLVQDYGYGSKSRGGGGGNQFNFNNNNNMGRLGGNSSSTSNQNSNTSWLNSSNKSNNKNGNNNNNTSKDIRGGVGEHISYSHGKGTIRSDTNSKSINNTFQDSRSTHWKFNDRSRAYDSDINGDAW